MKRPGSIARGSNFTGGRARALAEEGVIVANAESCIEDKDAPFSSILGSPKCIIGGGVNCVPDVGEQISIGNSRAEKSGVEDEGEY